MSASLTRRAREPSVRKPMTGSAWWALGLLGGTVPAVVLGVVLVEAIAGAMGMGMGTPSTPDEVEAQTWLNYGFFAVVAAPMVASFVVGLRAWRRAHDSIALTAGLIALAMLVAGATAVVVTWL